VGLRIYVSCFRLKFKDSRSVFFGIREEVLMFRVSVFRFEDSSLGYESKDPKSGFWRLSGTLRTLAIEPLAVAKNCGQPPKFST